jgi:hypothetical protein
MGTRKRNSIKYSVLYLEFLFANTLLTRNTGCSSAIQYVLSSRVSANGATINKTHIATSPSSPWGILRIADDWISLIIGQPSKYYFGRKMIALTSFDSIVDPVTSALPAEPFCGSKQVYEDSPQEKKPPLTLVPSTEIQTSRRRATYCTR